MKKQLQAGFTLVELVISMAIMGVIGLLAMDMLSQGANIYVSQSSRNRFTSQARSAFWHMKDNIRNQSDAGNFFQSGSDILSISDIGNQGGKYRLLANGTLTYEKDSVNHIISDDIIYTKSGFTYFDRNYNNITPAAGNAFSEEDALKVHLIKINLFFTEEPDSIELSTYMYSNNLRFGRKNSYHQ